MHLPDLTPCTYLPVADHSKILAVGWLEGDVEFPTERIAVDLYDKLCALSYNPWQPFVSAGAHVCTICQFSGASGSANFFVPDGDVVYVAPELITHYIAAHSYLPPREFLDAISACPEMRSKEYKKLLIKSGAYKLLTTPPTNHSIHPNSASRSAAGLMG